MRTPVFIFRCPVCANITRWRGVDEPACTGPSESRHDHPPVVMRLLRIADNQVDPARAEAHALGPLIISPPPHEIPPTSTTKRPHIDQILS